MQGVATRSGYKGSLQAVARAVLHSSPHSAPARRAAPTTHIRHTARRAAPSLHSPRGSLPLTGRHSRPPQINKGGAGGSGSMLSRMGNIVHETGLLRLCTQGLLARCVMIGVLTAGQFGIFDSVMSAVGARKFHFHDPLQYDRVWSAVPTGAACEICACHCQDCAPPVASARA